MQYYAKIKCITTSDWMEMMLERLCGPTKKKKIAFYHLTDCFLIYIGTPFHCKTWRNV